MGDQQPLTPLQRSLLEFVTDDVEPTWIMLKELPETNADRPATEAALRDLESRNLVRATRAPGGHPDAATWDEPDDWWGLTEEGWALVGLDPPPGYPNVS